MSIAVLVQHLSNNYRFICQYSRVSICLDFELISAQHNQREAFSIDELDETRTRLNHLLSCQQDLDDIWRLARWLVHVIHCAKDKTYSGIPLKAFHSTVNARLVVQQPSTTVADVECRSAASVALHFHVRTVESGRVVSLPLHVPFTTTLNEMRMLIEQHNDHQQTPVKSIVFVWMSPDGSEHSLDNRLTAHDLQQRLRQFGGQLNVERSDVSLPSTTTVDARWPTSESTVSFDG
jgi:hypothetical protein